MNNLHQNSCNQLPRGSLAPHSWSKFLNVQVTGLSGRPHPVLSSVLTTQDVVRARVHVKMLAGDYLCSSYLHRDRGQDPSCRLCQAVSPFTPAPVEDMVHLLTRCRATAETRAKITPVLLNTISDHQPSNTTLQSLNHEHLTQPH